MRRRAFRWLRIAPFGVAVCVAACGGGGGGVSTPANEVVRRRIASLAPAANLAHRGTGPNRPLSPQPENSLPAYRDAIEKGADGVELDVELTSDRRLLVMHDDTLDRTTTCSGCVNAYTLATARSCFLRDGRGQVTDQHPPTLEEAYAALPSNALVNIELKVYGEDCATPNTGAVNLARITVAEVQRLRATRRTLFSSFEEVAVVTVKDTDPSLYAALLTFDPQPGVFEHAAALGLDAVHPFHTGVAAEDVAAAHTAGLQINLWTVDTRPLLQRALDLGIDAIITDEPETLAALLGR